MAKKMSFEDAFGRLNEIVKNLEEGDVPLEESMKLYEEGMRLGSLCRSILSEAEERMKSLASEGDDHSGKGDE
ncbi:MAG: exodeoxyribonuclease VII small subunit [Candidatus Krumholzibacteria bacterium]|nr:exodeoxyribonuclease VII small subunit [Candidatus Krumholzibacteria bacterium]